MRCPQSRRLPFVSNPLTRSLPHHIFRAFPAFRAFRGSYLPRQYHPDGTDLIALLYEQGVKETGAILYSWAVISNQHHG